jgi:hypothetical protein
MKGESRRRAAAAGFWRGRGAAAGEATAGVDLGEKLGEE